MSEAAVAEPPTTLPHTREVSVWWFAFGYFAAYAPYSALTKILSEGLWKGIAPLTGLHMLPVTVLASTVAMTIFMIVSGWWRAAGTRRVGSFDLPMPRTWTFLSGLCTSAIVLTTTLAYTFEGVSIVFVMLLMRGGVLMIAPIVDFVGKRRVQWFSWIGLALSFGALIASIWGRGLGGITAACALDIAVYLAAYFLRLRFMSRNAKSTDANANKRYFVEEQLVATPSAIILLGVVAVSGDTAVATQIREGFTDVWSSAALPVVIVVGVLSQLTGVFGGLILLDKRENSWCVPVNRASSVLAGVVASFGTAFALSTPVPATPELIGAAMVLAAIAMLSLPPLLAKRRARESERSA